MVADSEPDFVEVGELLSQGPSDIVDEQPRDSVWPAIEAETHRHRRTNGRQRAAIAVALVAAILLVAVPLGLAARSYQRTTSDDSADPELIDLVAIEDDVDATGWAELTGRDLAIGVENLAPLAAGTYELWLLDAATDGDGEAPAWIGTIGTSTEFEVDESVDLESYRVVDISIEPDDGDASHSGDSVLRGALSATDGG